MVKVRFAPSPTGHMHLGNSRIAIINHLFSLKNKGHFLLRIEDTDKLRSKKEYEDSIKYDLEWLGIHYDSTFNQSERTYRYDELKNKLIEDGQLYKCYETQEELEYRRKIAIACGKPPVYDRASLKLSDGEKKKLEDSGIKPYWRFMLQTQVISWNDIVFGSMSYDLKSLSDPVVQKADGTYLFAFSSMIDDFDHDVTHVIRGQDHLTNTAIQIAMFQEIYKGCKRPFEFAHLSLLVNSDGSKFSKRFDSLNLQTLRDNGIDNMAISSMMATIGSSLDVVPMTSMAELAEYFDITKFSNNSPKFDMNDLYSINKKVCHKYSYGDVIRKEEINISEDVFNLVHENIEKLADLHVWNNIFQKTFVCDYKFTDSEKDLLRKATDSLETEQIADWMESLKKKTSLSGKDLYMPIRMAITGMLHGPNITDTVKVMGKTEVKRRLLAVV